MIRRRDVVGWLGASALASACRPGRTATEVSANPISGVLFDLFTLFDPRGVDARVEQVIGQGSLATTWKTRLFEYCWIRAAAGQFVPFDQLVRDSLEYAARASQIEISSGDRATLCDAFTELELWPDAAETLTTLRTRGLKLAPLANYAPTMIDQLLGRVGILGLFDELLSTQRAETYKPARAAYALGERAFGLPRERIAFAAFGGWDAAGARWFGYPTFWVHRGGAQRTGGGLSPPQNRGGAQRTGGGSSPPGNRGNAVREVLIDPTASGGGLRALASWALSATSE
ncbi:MAG: haloacid dehalogenase type II [Polyangiaceae bacterium]